VIKRTQVWFSSGKVVETPFDTTSRHIRKQWPWVPDGIYDNINFQVRYKIVQGFTITNISKMWLDNGGPKGEPPEMLLPWGSYPDTPPKPQK